MLIIMILRQSLVSWEVGKYRKQVSGTSGSTTVSPFWSFYARVHVLTLHSPRRAEREGLRWIKKHIAAFGGDPDKVTLYAISHPSPLPLHPQQH